MRYLAIGPYCWGEGDTPDKARRRAKRNMPSYLDKKTAIIQVWEVGPKAEITGTGGISYPKDEMEPKLVPS